MKTLAFIGAVWTLVILVFSFTPGLAFHLYAGTEDGAAKWHQAQAATEQACTGEAARRGTMP